MNVLPQMEPITRLQRDHNSVLTMLTKGPVILTQRSKPAAVMVSPDAWDATAKELRRLRHLELSDRVSREAQENPSTVTVMTGEELVDLHRGL